ncbi:hypothetical protein ACLBWX_00210 [Methylobacterium sp. M6A4_1b]
MRRLLTGGIKAILAVAALSTAAHWTLRLQREPTPSVRAQADFADPVTTGSITPRRAEPAVIAEPAPDFARTLDQRHLSELFAGASPEKAKVQQTAVKR